jgi:hypothetical protein
MTASSCLRDYFFKDPAYGLNDWSAVVAFVRGLMENSMSTEFVWPAAKQRTLADNSLLSQTFIQHFGTLRDQNAIPILKEKLSTIGRDDMSIKSPWMPESLPLEWLCLQSLARIGGGEAKDIIEKYAADINKDYLSENLRGIKISSSPRNSKAACPDDYPEILKPITVSSQIFGLDYMSPESESQQLKKAFQSLKFPGIVESLSGDGRTTTFTLKNKITDHIHNFADPFCDFGIFISNPKVEYPVGTRRWAISHTFLYFPVIDGDFYDKEYTWDVSQNTITTHFHEHISIEEVKVNPDGCTVNVARNPISTGIELRGNTFSKQCTSAVRGIWDNPQKQGHNYYTRRANIITPYKKLYYFAPLHQPIVNQLGIWVVNENEKPERFFNSDGICIDEQGVINELLIPLHQPKILAWNYEQYEPKNNNKSSVNKIIEKMRVDLSQVPDASILDKVMGAKFEHSKCGDAGAQQNNANGYINGFDINSDGIIDQKDRELLVAEQGNVYRMNIGDFGYFGFNWLSIGNFVRSQSISEPAIYVCSYDYGAGYDPDFGKIRLAEPVTLGKKLYVEYFVDVPPVAGKDNIKVYLHPTID